ncbi:alpha/beta fold hydrolase [Congregibacter brevis]|uniref:Alpha/beta fold hydrolase n=1 Tax=Congregibacter brevis TaxID=3081201 RepID=A0ABZ0IBX1_9GAMM|nr:alpha/beta fold hydrolase [Congregibacter sp. IMCC45268]
MRHFLISKLLISLFVLDALPVTSAEEELSMSNGEYVVPGILSLPAQTNHAAPAVLLLHGTASQKNEVGDLYLQLAQKLAAEGIASLRIDLAGAGDSAVDHLHFSLSSATRDAQTAFDFLSTHPLINNKKIAVLGFSQGGLIAQRLVLKEPRALALATWSTAAANGRGSFARFFDEHYREALRTGHASVAFPWLSEPLRFSLQWFTEIDEQQTLTEMQGYKAPILCIAGTADSTVAFEQSEELINVSTHPMSQLVLLAGADHIFNVLAAKPSFKETPTHSDRLLSTTVSWLSELFDHYSQSAGP